MLPLSSCAHPPRLELPAPEPTLGGSPRLWLWSSLLLSADLSVCPPTHPSSEPAACLGSLSTVVLMPWAGLLYANSAVPAHSLPYATLDLPLKYLGGKSHKVTVDEMWE